MPLLSKSESSRVWLVFFRLVNPASGLIVALDFAMTSHSMATLNGCGSSGIDFSASDVFLMCIQPAVMTE